MRYTLSVIRCASPASASSSFTSTGSTIRYSPWYALSLNTSTYCVLRAPKGSSSAAISRHRSQFSLSRIFVSSFRQGSSATSFAGPKPGTFTSIFLEPPSRSRVNSTR